MEEGYSLAAMGREDFEHLIRELFEKEFTASGGEVKVTQASRDGGVDAIAFDPDPIRGGKIVIQAKRYTNTVLEEPTDTVQGGLAKGSRGRMALRPAIPQNMTANPIGWRTFRAERRKTSQTEKIILRIEGGVVVTARFVPN